MTNRSELATARGGEAGRQGGPTASNASISDILDPGLTGTRRGQDYSGKEE